MWQGAATRRAQVDRNSKPLSGPAIIAQAGSENSPLVSMAAPSRLRWLPGSGEESENCAQSWQAYTPSISSLRYLGAHTSRGVCCRPRAPIQSSSGELTGFGVCTRTHRWRCRMASVVSSRSERSRSSRLREATVFRRVNPGNPRARSSATKSSLAHAAEPRHHTALRAFGAEAVVDVGAARFHSGPRKGET